MAHQHSFDELNAMLQARAFEVLEAVFGRGRVMRRGNQAWILNPARKDPNWTSFSYNLASGVWKDFSDASGQAAGKWPLHLIATFATRGDYKSERDASGTIVREGAVEWTKRFLGLVDRPLSQAEAAQFAARQRADDAREQERRAKARSGALRYWIEAMKRQNGARPLDGTDPASRYLASRGLDVMAMREGAPRALAFHPAVYAQDCDPAWRGPWPALIACISREGLPQGFAALHRTYLVAERGAWTKRIWPNCKTGKQIKGAFAGGSIRLTRGASGKPLAQAPDEIVQVTEGIEDGLTAAIAEPALRTIVGVSVSNIGGLVLPAQIKQLQIWAQNDEEPMAIAQFDDAMDKLAARGIEPWIVTMPANFKDSNDLLCGKQKPAHHELRGAVPREAAPAA